MKVALSFTLTFLLVAFLTKLPLAFSQQQVFDTLGNPISPGGQYYILPATGDHSGGGVTLGKTGNSKCRATVLQEHYKLDDGISVKFTTRGHIQTGKPLEIEFTEKPICADSSKWFVAFDNSINKAFVGIGGPKNHPGTQTLDGTFNIKKYSNNVYKLGFCETGSSCLDIGTFDNGEGGRRLVLDERVTFNVVFVDAESYKGGIIKSVA